MSTTIRIDLPWTRPPLTLNDRRNRYPQAALIASVRNTAGWLARSHLPRRAAHLTVRLHYRPRDNRVRDPINLTLTQKALVDGIVAMGVVPGDDPRYVTDLMPVIHRADKTLGAAVWLEITVGHTGLPKPSESRPEAESEASNGHPDRSITQ